MACLGVEALINTWVRTGSALPGRKVSTLVAAMLAGATHIDHAIKPCSRQSTAVDRREVADLRNRLRRAAELSAPGMNRTCDARFRKPTLYPLSYGGWAG